MQKPLLQTAISTASLSPTARAAVAMWLAQAPQAPATTAGRQFRYVGPAKPAKRPVGR